MYHSNGVAMFRPVWLVILLVIQLSMLGWVDVEATSIQGIVEASLEPFASQIITLYRSVLTKTNQSPSITLLRSAAQSRLLFV
jgi:hypothetical protein